MRSSPGGRRWSHRSVAAVLAIAFIALLGRHEVSAQEDGSAVPAGVLLREVQEADQTLWLYRPRTGPVRALIVVPPAGGTLLTAPGLGPGDRAEHVPYVGEGFAVVAFSLSGELSGRVTRDDALRAIGEFAQARGGVRDAQRAIERSLATWPDLADLPILAAGHSSAANLVLALGAEDARIRGVAAYAPAADTLAFIEGNMLEGLAREVPGALELARELSPIQLAEKLRTPALLFQAEDDNVTSAADTRRLARKLQERGVRTKLVTVPTGGHYDAMLSEGIPEAIRWFEELLAAPQPFSR